MEAFLLFRNSKGRVQSNIQMYYFDKQIHFMKLNFYKTSHGFDLIFLFKSAFLFKNLAVKVMIKSNSFLCLNRSSFSILDPTFT